MRSDTPLEFGPAPSPGEVEAAMRRGRALRSQAFHIGLKRARRAATRALARRRGQPVHGAPCAARGRAAPIRRNGEALWSMLTGLPRRWTLTRDRVL